MKAKTFENLIRKVVREEIDYALRREIKSLKEDLRDELKPTITEHKERMVEVPEAAKNSLREKIMGKKTFAPKSFTSNQALNDLLNETAQGDTNLESGNTPGMPIEAMPQPVQKVVNRDYRALMQAIDKKKGK
jgi:dGTP triphosphohydrolase|tara:strand:+ start:131 stop:529 length:399 start_codon:yes stop_codon:yes gene_type:complete